MTAVVSVTVVSAGLLVVTAGIAQAAQTHVKDPGTDWGHGTDITRLGATNSDQRVRISANYRNGDGDHARYILSAVHPRDLESASVIIRRATDGSVTARFWILEPESAGKPFKCKGMKHTWLPAQNKVTVSFPQSCYREATGRKTPSRWYFTGFTGGGVKAGDTARTKPIRRS